MADLKYEIIETLATLSEGSKGWKRQLNLISWNDRDPKYDVRDWSEDQTKMGKGVTFTLAELQALKNALNELPELEKIKQEITWKNDTE
ncbi:YdbC family protein [Paenisporosarcina sp. TG20]|uniref:YdbC family protein n=1 Tax=Paenisporosarcina sp. TG20 TaxID=1211706 RepID=UPI0002D49042|nr:PC4/YdbC family ssDNA-binding protein [Paenisporosarcina sp. TG20]